jgi:sulfite reductase (NADPH) flavoprotein alpha-component
MAPVAVVPSGVLAAKAALVGTETPYSTSSTAVSEAGDKSDIGSPKALPLGVSTLLPGQPGYIESLVNANQALPTTVAGETVVASGLEIIEALAVQNSTAVWVYDDAVQVGFGTRLAGWDADKLAGATGKVHPVQAREGAGLELAGYAKKAAGGMITVFASTSTLPLLAPHISAIDANIVIHVATTDPAASLELTDALAAPGVIKALTALPEDWDVVFSAGADVVATAASLYTTAGKTVHIVESTYSARQTTSYKFPAAGAFDEFTVSAASDELYLAVASAAASSITAPKIVLNTLSPSPEALLAILSGETKKTVTVTGPTRADAEALKALVLAILFSAPTSSTAAFPTVKAAVTPAPVADESAKTITFFTAHGAPLPQLLAQLYAASPALATTLAEYGSTWTTGKKSVLALSQGLTSTVTASSASDLVWVSDAALLKHADILTTAKDGASLVLELPWAEEDLPTKLSAAEIQTIQQKKLRVFLLSTDATCPLNPIREQAAFLLLYTGSQKLPLAVWKVLDAFHGGNLGRNQVEEAQAGLSEVPASEIATWAVDPETVGKTKAAWVWDALAASPVALEAEPSATLSSWEVAARHVLFREAYAVEDAKTVDAEKNVPGINALSPELAEETFLVTVVENRRLTPESYDRNIFHLEMDTAGTGLKYAVGEALGIHGWNEADEVAEFCAWYGLDPEGVVIIPNPAIPGTNYSRTIFQLLQQNIDLFGQPGKSFYGELSKFATKRDEAMKLKFISVPEGAELYQRLSENETVNFADVLRAFPSARPSFQELLQIVPEIKPRHYSIASSQNFVGDKVELLIVTVDWTDITGRKRFGQCTRYLHKLKTGAKITVSIKPSVMRLPEDPKAPVIMAGLGTGMGEFLKRSRVLICSPFPRILAGKSLATFAGHRGRPPHSLLRLALPLAGVPVWRGCRGVPRGRHHHSHWSCLLARRPQEGLHPAQDEGGQEAPRRAHARKRLHLYVWPDVARTRHLRGAHDLHRRGQWLGH